MSKYNYEQKRNDYESPPELVKIALQLVKADEFDLDVCCSRRNIPAKNHYILGEYDGLMNDWEKLNWCNPPFDECKQWIKRAFEEMLCGNTTVMLLPVRTETKYWHDYILWDERVKIYWLRKGYQFINPNNNEPCGVFKNALSLVIFSPK